MPDVGSLLGGLGVGGNIGAAIVQLELDTAKYQAEMRAAHAQTTASTSGMGNALTAFGGVAKAGLLAVGVGVAAFGANAIKAASDLGEAVNKSNVIFGNNAAEIERWAEGGAEAFGLSKTAALDAAGGFGAMLQTAGLAVSESANMSKALVELAGDMASFNNIDPTEALEKLRSGLAGEAEPLRRFGVFLSEAAVQQEAYASGIAKTGEELTEAQKVQARYNIIFEQTTKQQGDFARTADSVPNQLRSIRAEFENISAEVGTQLLPAVTSLLGALKDLLPLLTLIGEGFAAVGGVISDFTKAITLQESEFTTLAGALEENARLLKAGEITLTEFDERMRAVAKQTELNFETSEEYNKELERMLRLARQEEGIRASGADAAEAYTRSLIGMRGATRGVAKETKDLTDDFEFQEVTLEDLATATRLSRDEFVTYFRTLDRNSRDLRKAAQELRDEKWLNQDFVDFLSMKGPEWIVRFGDLNETQQRRWQESWERSNERTKKANENLVSVRDTLDKIDRSKTDHTVKIKYEYVGFDPSKPGMGGNNNTPSELGGG